MVSSKPATMSDRRALLTDREREIITGEADVSDSYRYQTISRVRSRFTRLSEDLDAFASHGDLLDELREVVCTDIEHKDAETPGGDRVEEHDPQGSHPENTSPPTQEEEDLRADAERRLRELGLPGLGDDLEGRIEALLAMHDLLREHEGERVEADQLKDVADQYAHGYADADSFWSNCVKKNSTQGRPNAVKALPGVREAGSGEYTYDRE